MLSRLFPQENYTEGEELTSYGKAGRKALGPTIRVLVWNILKATRSGWVSDFRNLTVDRDLVLLQEAVIGTHSDHLFHNSRRVAWVMARSFHDPRSGVDHGVKTGAVAPSVCSRSYLSPHTEPLSQTQKMMLETRYPLQDSNQELLVLNMHAINFVSVRKYLQQLAQLEEALADYEGPVILAGDFNTWNVRRMRSFHRIATGAELTEVVMQRPTRLAHLNRHLDHLFYRGLELRSAESLFWLTSSDHAPITATFADVS